MSDNPMFFILFDRKRNTYILGGGSSSPAKERIYYSIDAAKQNRDRYFPTAEIHPMWQGTYAEGHKAGQEAMRERAAFEIEPLFGNADTVVLLKRKAECIRVLPIEEPQS